MEMEPGEEAGEAGTAVADKQEEQVSGPVSIWGPYVLSPVTGRLHGPRPTSHHDNYSYMQRAWHEYEYGIHPTPPPPKPKSEEERAAYRRKMHPDLHLSLRKDDGGGTKKRQKSDK